MKQKIPKHVLLVSFLLAGMIFSFSKVANATEEARYKIIATMCCNGPVLVGLSNNCAIGSGNCVDHSCNAGETESTSGCDY